MEAARVIDLKTGEVLDGPCEDCTNYERELRAKRRRITLLENQLADRREAAAEAKDISEVLSYWRDRCTKRPGSVVFAPGGDRWEKVRDRLSDDLPGREGGWTVAELKLAVDGALISPFHNGTDPKTRGKQYLDARTIFKNAEVVGSHVDRALKFNDLIGVLPSEFLRAFVGMDVKTDLAVCDCGHYRLFHLSVPETGGREVCRKCDCGGWSQGWGK